MEDGVLLRADHKRRPRARGENCQNDFTHKAYLVKFMTSDHVNFDYNGYILETIPIHRRRQTFNGVRTLTTVAGKAPLRDRQSS